MADQMIGILGAGTMGAGLAALAAGYGMPVAMVDVDPAVVGAAISRVRQHLRTGRLVAGLPIPSNAGALVRVTTDLNEIAQASVVVECLPEDAALKRRLIGEAAEIVRPDTVLTTNTSAIPVDELADALPHPEKLVGTHFMNPPYAIEGVEVVCGPRTAPEALATVTDLLRRLGRQPVVVGDAPGFVINRILQHMINEAARVVQEGIAGAEQVDALFTRCLGHRIGPLGTADLIGLDNVVDTLKVLEERTGVATYEPCALLIDKVRRGELGRKSGTGFFDYRESP